MIGSGVEPALFYMLKSNQSFKARSLKKYYVDVADGDTMHIDTIGGPVELFHVAKREAVLALSDLVHTRLLDCEETVISVRVRDERGLCLFEATVTCATAPTDGSGAISPAKTISKK